MIFKKAIRVLCVFSLVAISNNLKSQALDYDFSAFRQLIEETIHKNDIPGMQVAIISKDSILWKGNFGYADLQNGTPVSDCTMFRVGSVSKPFVALSAMILQERGVINIHDRLRETAPEVEFTNRWEDTHPVRMVHLLEHTAGFDDVHPVEFLANAEGWSTLQGLQLHPHTRTSRRKPGMFMSYSNIGTTCAAYVVEKMSHQPYEEFVQVNLFDPLGMNNSGFFLNDYMISNLAKGYASNDSRPVEYSHILARPSGALMSNVTELAALVQLFLNRGTFSDHQLLKPGSVDRIERTGTTLAAQSGYERGYGLCMFSGLWQGYPIFYHHGTINGYISSLQYCPELEIGFIILTNTSRETGLPGFIHEFQSLVIPDSIRKPALDAAFTITLSKDVTGWYEKSTHRTALGSFIYQFLHFMKIGKENGQYYYKKLFFGQWDLIPYSENSLITVDFKSSIPFVFVDDGQGNEYLQRPMHESNYRKISGFVVWGKISLLILSMLVILSALTEVFFLLYSGLVKRRKAGMTLSRILPLSAIVIGVLWMLFYANYFSFYTMGKIGVESVGFFTLSVLFAGLSVAALMVNLLKLKYKMNKWVRIHSFIVSSFCVLATVYLYFNDFIGLRGWIY